MWGTCLFMPSFYSPLSVLWAMSCLSLLLAAGLWLSVGARMRSRNLEGSSSGRPNTSSPKEFFHPPSTLKVVCILIFAAFTTGIYVHWLLAQYPVFEYTMEKDGCCKVISQDGPHSWTLEKSDGQWQFTACDDYHAEKIIWAGYVMRKLRYEDRGYCQSIARKDLGVWWLRDPVTKDVATIN